MHFYIKKDLRITISVATKVSEQFGIAASEGNQIIIIKEKRANYTTIESNS